MSHIAIIYSAPTRRMLATPYGATDEDSSSIAEKVSTTLTHRGYAVSVHRITEDTIATIGEIRADCIFNLIEWCGLDIELAKQSFVELRKLQIPVTGATEQLFVLTGDKIALKAALRLAGASVPRGMGFTTGSEDIPSDFPYPAIVKPSTEHCSMGLSGETVATDDLSLRRIVRAQIAAFRQPALAEEFIAGREFEVYLLEEAGRVRVLPIEEVLFPGDNPMAFQTYDCKWTPGSSDYEHTDVVRAKFTPNEQKIIEDECARAFTALKFRGYARFDVRYRDNIPYLLETNANPSVYDGDAPLFNPDDEVIFGIRFSDYIEAIVQSALWHYTRAWEL